MKFNQYQKVIQFLKESGYDANSLPRAGKYSLLEEIVEEIKLMIK